MPRFRILLIGAYGQFGSRIAAELGNDDVDLMLAGRDRGAADALARRLLPASARIRTARMDVDAPSLAADIAALAPDLVIHTAGPFQQRDYRVAKAALACDAHYVDLADGRAFVCGIDALDAAARARGRWVISGASSVPGLSGAVVAAHAHRFARLASLESAITPGNRTERGLATTRAILGYVGRPFRARIGGQWRDVHGWQSLRRLEHAATGMRWLARCDVPDLDVLPARYPTLSTCDFRAGLELRRMHFGLWFASWAVRMGMLRNLPAWAPLLLRISERWRGFGSDTGLMRVDMTGRGHDGEPLHLRWTLTARDGSGPQIPATAAVVLARRLAAGSLPGSGARACMGLFTLDDFMAALAAYPIEATLERL